MIHGKKNGKLPEALVKRFGEDAIRRAIGLGKVSERVMKRRQERIM